MTDRSREDCARHEAGHAVMAVFLGARGVRADLESRGDYLGRTIWPALDDFDNAVVTAAGSVAEGDPAGVLGSANDASALLEYERRGVNTAGAQAVARLLLAFLRPEVGRVASALLALPEDRGAYVAVERTARPATGRSRPSVHGRAAPGQTRPSIAASAGAGGHLRGDQPVLMIRRDRAGHGTLVRVPGDQIFGRSG